MPAPRSDYRCSRCNQTYELPVGTLTCPGCGKSKWFTRQYSAQISTSGVAARKDPQLEAAYSQAMQPREAGKLSDRQRGAPMLAVDIQQAPNVLAHFAKSQFQQAGLPENRMGSIEVAGGMGGLKPGKSSWRKGEITRKLPVDPSLTGEMKLHPPKARVAGRDVKAGEFIARALRK